MKEQISKISCCTSQVPVRCGRLLSGHKSFLFLFLYPFAFDFAALATKKLESIPSLPEYGLTLSFVWPIECGRAESVSVPCLEFKRPTFFHSFLGSCLLLCEHTWAVLQTDERRWLSHLHCHPVYNQPTLRSRAA